MNSTMYSFNDEKYGAEPTVAPLAPRAADRVLPFLRFQPQRDAAQRTKSRFGRRDGSGVSYSLGIVFRRLALICFLETIIATYLVHRAEVNAAMASANLATVLVLLVGFFLAIVLCAASVAFSSH